MRVQCVKNRGTLFTSDSPGWDYNMYLIRGETHNFIIDTGLGAGSVASIRKQIKDDHKEIVVINTHHHWDHVWGNGAFAGCTIVAHQLCRGIIASEWAQMIRRHGQYAEGEVVMRLPNLVFQRELYFAEDGIRVFHTPGHTPDSISVLDEADGVLMLADNIGDSMDDIVPSIGFDVDIYRNTLKQYEEMRFDTCVSGHNRVLGKEVIQTILNTLQRSI